MRRLALPVAWVCSAAGAWAMHRLGPEGRRFVAEMAAEFTTELATDVALRAHPPAKPRRHP